jgi:PAS domain S-box-containing protein/putative nucleotidyltransferase with HDIG domain
VASTIFPIPDARGGRQFICMDIDVTARKRAEEELRRTTARLQLQFDRMPIGCVLWDPDFRVVSWNPAAERIFGFTETEALGRRPHEFIVPCEVRPHTEGIQARLLQGDEGAHSVNENVTRDGRTILCQWTNTPLKEPDGTVLGVLSMVEDITDRRKAEAALQESVSTLRRTLSTTITTMAKIVETKDPYTAGHQLRVAELAELIAREMGLPPERVQGLHMAAMIHDIGKIYIPAEILSKPGQLTRIEIDMIRTHPNFGAEVLKAIPFPWPIADMILQHHERLDGSGYPKGLKGEEILLEARILCVADVVEAMATHRPYRAARGLVQALQEIQDFRGRYYDPGVVDACLTVIRQGLFAVDGPPAPR